MKKVHRALITLVYKICMKCSSALLLHFLIYIMFHLLFFFREFLLFFFRNHRLKIYDIFLQLTINEACDVKTLKQFITSNFISEFLQLFDSDLPEERDFLKNILLLLLEVHVVVV